MMIQQRIRGCIYRIWRYIHRTFIEFDKCVDIPTPTRLVRRSRRLVDLSGVQRVPTETAHAYCNGPFQRFDERFDGPRTDE